MPKELDDRAQNADVIHKQFEDLAIYSPEEKTAISVRDGVIEYLGIELGMEPSDKIFSVYRSPATIANVHPLMVGIPLTDEHVSIDLPPPDTGSKVNSARMVDAQDEFTKTSIAIENKLSLSDSAAVLLKDKRQLSLGYNADLIPHSRYDFEQINIMPHHLAAVEAGRCGPLCSFLDRKPTTELNMAKKELNKAFLDEDGQVSLEQVVEMATALPEAIRKIPVEKLSSLVPALQEMMSYAQEQGAVPESEMEDEDMKEGEQEVTATDEDMPEEDKPKFSDRNFADAVAKQVKKETARYSEVVNKARNFLDDSYSFSGKTANQIMRDALATQSTDSFEDNELSVAFKLLRKSGSDYSKFGDSALDNGLTSRIKSELGEE